MGQRSQLPSLLFVHTMSSGPSRRMQSVVAWIKVTQKKRLRVIEVDADDNPAIVERLEVNEVPSLVLIRGSDVLGRIEGKATGRQIEDLIRPHLSA